MPRSTLSLGALALAAGVGALALGAEARLLGEPGSNPWPGPRPRPRPHPYPPHPPHPHPPSPKPPSPKPSHGTDWAVLIAGSAGWGNYRHQADICHAYQILSAGGLKDDNIVVMMTDDLAHNPSNPHPGTLINKPDGSDVYKGTPKDYTGSTVTGANFLKVIAGDKEGLQGTGTGKVLESGPEDNVFIYFADHGGPGILGMPSGPLLKAKDLVDTLVDAAKANRFKKMVIYVEACESGSIFKGLIPDDLNIYVMTAANEKESSWGYYCPGMHPPPPAEYNTCLGDLFSIAWMENADANDLSKETLEEQFKEVRDRTSQNGTYVQGSHVQQFGTVTWEKTEPCADFMGAAKPRARATPAEALEGAAVEQREADLVSLRAVYAAAAPGPRKDRAKAELDAEVAFRAGLDAKIAAVVDQAIANKKVVPSVPAKFAASVFNALAPEGEPLTRDWECFALLVDTFDEQCGGLGQYGMKYGRAFANACNRGLEREFLDAVAQQC